jgi:glycosyltransferase involved in cell wall biosynthesis
MRVLHLLKTSAGASWALRQMRELVNLGIDVHVALPADGPLVRDYTAAGIQVHPAQFDFPLSRPWTAPARFKQLRELVSEIQPSLIHSHFVGTTLTMRLALGKNHLIPRIFQVPGPLHLEHAFFRQAELMTAGSADKWVGSCQWTCRQYNRYGISPERLFLSYYGVDIERFKAGEKGKLRHEFGIGSRSQIVGMVAYMYAPKRHLGQRRGLKGHEDLIDAIALCLKEGQDIFCVFIGGAWNNATAYEKQVRAYAQQRLGQRAIFLGTRSDVAELYPDIDVVVHPSHSENVGGTAESLLLAVPTIASNVGGLPDLVKHQETGWLVPSKSPERLAEAIRETLQHPRRAREMAVAGQQLASQLFDVKQTARQVSQIYQTILTKREAVAMAPSHLEPQGAVTR